MVNIPPSNQYVFFLIQLLLALIIIPSYFHTIRMLISTPLLYIGLILGLLSSILDKKLQSPKLLSIENILLGVLPILFIGTLEIMDYWESGLIRIWSNVLLVALILTTGSFETGMRGSSNPILQRTGRISHLFIPPFLATVIVGFVTPSLISNLTFKISVSTAALLIVLLQWRSGNLRRLTAIEEAASEYEKLSTKQASLEKTLENLQNAAGVIGDEEMRDQIEEVIDIVRRSHNKSVEKISDMEFEEANNYLVQAEKEVEKIESLFENQIHLSLADELIARLDQAEAQISDIKSELEDDGREPNVVEDLQKRVEKSREEVRNRDIDQIDIYSEELPLIIQDINNIVSEIREIRVALRFKKNVASAVDRMKDDIEEEYETLIIADELEMEISHVEEIKDDLLSQLAEFSDEPIVSRERLVGKYREIQSLYADYTGEVEAILSDMERDWNRSELVEDTAYAYIPKTCETYRPTRGAVISENEDIEFDIKGTLLESPGDETLKTNEMANGDIAIGSFDVAGKNGGIGRIYINCNHKNGTQDFQVRIVPEISEIAQDSITYVPVLAGISVIMLWIFDMNLSAAGAVALAIGGVAGLFVFFIQYLRLRMGFSNSLLNLFQRIISYWKFSN